MFWTEQERIVTGMHEGPLDRWLAALGRWFERRRARRIAQASPRALLDWETESHREIERYGVLNRRAIGVRAIDVRRIVGSVTGTHEWDGRFQPFRRDPQERQRFANVLSAMAMGEPLPPITVYKLRRVYFVVDGRHRVGAAKQLGWETIAADVTVLVPGGDPDEQAVFHERQRFEASTGLLLVEAARPGTYDALLREIQAYRQDRLTAADAALNLPDASTRWYYRVFIPALALVRGSSARQLATSLCSADILAYLLAAERRGMPLRREQHAISHARVAASGA